VNINYASISKVLEEKNSIILGQEKSIENLRVCLEKVKRELEGVRGEYDRNRVEDISALKKSQK
jgi:hypothetical protein